VREAGKVGYTYLRPSEIVNLVETPSEPYYLFNIEDGQAMRGKSPEHAQEEINNQGRRGLTEMEVIALGIHSDVLSRHPVDAVASRCPSDEVVSLWLSVDGPQLVSLYIKYRADDWGAASCVSTDVAPL